MDIFEILKNRRSVRSFKQKPLPADIINQIIEAGIAAPSAGNTEPRIYIVIQNPEVKAQLSSAASEQAFIFDAPAIIAVCADTERSAAKYGPRGRELYSLLDASASVQNMLLAAYAMGLGACWIGSFKDEEVMRVLNLPEHIKPIALIPIGYADEKPLPPPKVSLKDVTFTDRYS